MNISTEKFLSFLRREKEEKEKWVNVKAKWMDDLYLLYSKIKEWLKDAVEDGLLEVTDKTVELVEDELGPYQAPGIVIRFGEKDIEFRPGGRFVLGARGRVDIRSDKGVVSLLHDSSKIQGWSLFDAGTMEQKVFDQESCLALFEELLS